MIIDKKTFTENFKIFDKDIVVEIIDIFKEEYPERMEQLYLACKTKDGELLRTASHGLKGVLANFYATKPFEITKHMEEKGKTNDFENIDTLLADLKTSCEELLIELETLRIEYS
ncbi:MAG: Hpt domain-containing protein [Bacteroidota bacterium]|nr:Hpt domain-containing protein [Bacteroidota bacterium]